MGTRFTAKWLLKVFRVFFSTATWLPRTRWLRTLRCGRSKLHTDERFMRTNGTLYLRYDEGAYYWEVLIMLRKLALVLITRFLASDQEQVVQLAGIDGEVAACVLAATSKGGAPRTGDTSPVVI